jgi:DNA-binding transcriptional LysR family regulator
MDLPDLDDMTFFHGLSRSTTLTAAARQWGVSTSAVSKRLSRLEERLGVRLVTRSTRRLHLTDEGERYAAGVNRLLPQLTDLEESISAHQGALRGRIAVASPIGLGRAHIAPLIVEFAHHHPGVHRELDLTDLPLNIADTPFDLAIRVGRLRDSRLNSRFLQGNHRVVCASPGYLADHGRPTELADLARHRCIVIKENENDYALWRFGTEQEPTTVRVTGTLASNDGDIATSWAVAGLGLIMRSTWQVDPLIREGRLVRVLEDIPTPDANVFAVYPAHVHETQRVREFLDHLRAGLGRRIAPIVARTTPDARID